MCKETYDELPTVSKVREKDHICGGNQNISDLTDTCQGDSGGPLMCQRINSCNWYVAGIVSFGLPTCGLTYGKVFLFLVLVKFYLIFAR